MSKTKPTEGDDSKPLQIAGIEIPVADQTPLVIALVAVIARQERKIQDLEDEIQRRKGTTRRPKISPSKLPGHGKPKRKPSGKRPGSAKRRKDLECRVTDTVALTLNDLPEGTRIEGYRNFYVQDLVIQPMEQYRWCEEAAESLAWLGAGKKLQEKMSATGDGSWGDRDSWERQLTLWGVESSEHRRLVSEAALCGTLLTESWYENLGLVSDDAPQFKLFGFVHGLCWVHGERKIDRLIPLTPSHVAAKERAQSAFWEIYARLKAYRETPTPAEREAIETEFDQLCSTKTQYPELDDALGKLGSKRDPFLKVLEHPHLPLHNNLSENDIREYARLRKISSGTRSDQGQRCRDTFLSLKKTCRKLGISFGAFLTDRLSGAATIPRLSDVMRKTASVRGPAATAESG